MHDVVFQQSVFQREKLKRHWPDLNKVISRGDEIVVAFEAVSAFPMWRKDPRLANLPAATAREILDIYNEIIADGRYVAEFLLDPKAAAKRLDLKISDEAVIVVRKVASQMVGANAAAVGAAIVVISISVVAIAAGTAIVSSRHMDRDSRILVDESGRVKLGDEFGTSHGKIAQSKSKSKTKTKPKKKKIG